MRLVAGGVAVDRLAVASYAATALGHPRQLVLGLPDPAADRLAVDRSRRSSRRGPCDPCTKFLVPSTGSTVKPCVGRAELLHQLGRRA